MKKFLLVDDSKFSCKREGELIKAFFSVDVDLAFLPSEGIRKVCEELIEYDLVFLDYNMPEMNGLELMEKLAERISPNRMILLTASSAFATRAHAVPKGVQLIQKPLNEDKLKSIRIPEEDFTNKAQ